MPLTALAVANAKPKSTPYKLSDGEGLYLLVNPNGARLWRVNYRFGDKHKTLAIGVYPTISLSAARAARLDAKQVLAMGVDPMAERKAKRKPTDDTFEIIATEWFKMHESKWAKSYSERLWGRLKREVFPEIGSKRIDDIKPKQVLDLAREMESRELGETTHRCVAAIGRVCRYAVATLRAETDPTSALRGALKPKPKVAHHKKVPQSEILKLWKDIVSYDCHQKTSCALRLTMLAMVRTNETRFATWSEIEDLDGAAPLWRIPASRMKMGREHLVPLSRQAADVLKEMRARDFEDCNHHIFGLQNKVISQNTMLYALYRMGYHGRQTVHGLRGLASTFLNEAEFNRDWIELQLAHDDDDEIRAAYNSAQWLPQRRKMLQFWADFLSPDFTS